MGVALGAALLLPAQPLRAAAPPPQGWVDFSSTKFENNFPVSLKFRVHVTAGRRITAARLYLWYRDESTKGIQNIEIEPATELDLEAVMLTADSIAVPSAPIFYQWEVTLDGGARRTSAEKLTYYDDIRYEWERRQKGNLAVWWHDRPDSFGSRAFDVAVRAMEAQEELYGATLDFSIRVILYNTKDEFEAWHHINLLEFGGQAFPSLGITTQVVEDGFGQSLWMNEVLPHEISHLYFHQVTWHSYADPPAWLNEGLATYNELHSHDYVLERVHQEILNGNHLPLRGLTGSFGYDQDRFERSYDVSLAAVAYLVDTYGEDGLARLLAAYKSGKPTSKAFPETFGLTVDQFEQEWLTSLGVPQGMYPTPTPPGTRVPLNQILTQRAVARLTPSVTPTPRPTSTPAPPLAVVRDSPMAPFAGVLSVLCVTVWCVLALLLLVIVLAARKKKHSPPHA